MRILFRLTLAVACAALVLPAYAQDKEPPPPPPAKPPARDVDRDPPQKDPPREQPQDREQPRDRGTDVDVQAQRMTGRIVSVDNNQVVVRTAAGKEVTFVPSAQTRFMIDGRAARLADFRVGSTINAAYVMDRDRYVLNSLVIGELPAPAAPVRPAQPAVPAEGTLVEGTIVKVVGNDQVIIKTADGKEITVHVTPQTKYTLTETGGAFVDLQPNLPVRMYYDLQDTRPVARRILRGAPPRPRRP